MAGLTLIEVERLQELEQVIDSGLESFVEVGEALATVRDEKLYRAEHRTFEAYCKDRWGFSRDYGYKLIAGSKAAKNVDHGIQKPNARQARELAKAPSEKQAEVWKKASSDGKPTVAKVKEAVAEVVDYQPPKARVNGKPKVATQDRKAIAQALGKLVRAIDAAGLIEEYRDLLDELSIRVESI